MPNAVLLCISLIMGLFWNVVRKFYTEKTPSGLFYTFFFNLFASLVAMGVLLVWGGFGTASAYTLWLGLLFGVITMLQLVVNIAAFRIGPLSYTTVIISFSTLITALSGLLFFHETLGWTQIVGIPLMLVSFVLAVDKKADENKGFSFKWMVLCFLAFLATGSIGILQKIHGSSPYSGEQNAFLIMAFLFAGLFNGVLALVCLLRDRRTETGKAPLAKLSWILFLAVPLGGVAFAAINKLNLYLSGAMESAVFFPIVNGGGLALTTIFSLLVFKERLSKKQWIGLFFGAASVIFLCLPS